VTITVLDTAVGRRQTMGPACWGAICCNVMPPTIDDDSPHSEDSQPPFLPFEERLTGNPQESVVLHTGMPEHLIAPLHSWLQHALNRDTGEMKNLAQEVALRLQIPGDYYQAVRFAKREQLLRVVDAVLHCSYMHGHPRDTKVLDRILELGGSAYKVNSGRSGLVRRVDHTVDAAAKQAFDSGPLLAGDFLRGAWQHVYGMTPDPNTAYREAVRAIEQAFVPVVSPNNTRASLGTVVRDLRNQLAKWELLLVDTNDQPGSIKPVVDLLDQLWQGQRSRHGGGANSRDQTQAEAEAAVHLAALAVHWISTETLRRKT
jgi:hypothetical protein